MKMISFSFILWAFNAIKWQALSTSHSFSFAQFLREKLQLSQLKWSIGQWHCQLLTRVVHQRKHYCPSFLSIVSLALVSFPNLFLKTSNCANPWFRRTLTMTITVKTYLWHWDAPVRSLGSRAFFDPSTDNRHFSDCGTFVFPAVFHVRRHTQILGVWRAESFLSCGYFPVFLVSIHLGSGIWDLGSDKQWAAETSLKSLSSVSDASSCRLPSGILLLIRLHHVFCYPLQRYHHHCQNLYMCVL